MRLILKLAFRNVWRHRGQSLVIGAILFLGALLMTVGNGIVTGMERGLQRTVARSFTGDLVVVPDAQVGDNVFMEMMGRSLEPLYGYARLQAVLDSGGRVVQDETRKAIERFMREVPQESARASTFRD